MRRQMYFDWLNGTGEGPENPGVVTILERVVERGQMCPGPLLSRIGKQVAQKFRERMGREPVTTKERFGRWFGRDVFGYPRSFVAVIDQCIDDSIVDFFAPVSRTVPPHEVIARVEARFEITLRKHQRDAIEAGFSDKDLILHAPTGSGKSVVFQALAHLTIEDGITVVVYPLRSLLEDQSLSADHLGLRPLVYYGGTLTKNRAAVLRKIRDDRRTPLLLTTPEALTGNRGLQNALKTRGTVRVVIDEGHVYDEWALTFRHSYQHMGKVLTRLGSPRVMLCSATLTARGAAKAAHALGRFSWAIVRAPSLRSNLQFVDMGCSPGLFLDRLVKGCGPKGSGIIFYAWRSSIDQEVKRLETDGQSVLKYHAGMKAKRRKQVQKDWMDSEQCVLATKAFGMGINKADVRFIAHAQLPTSANDYIQEVGRAGRDGKPALCFMPPCDFNNFRGTSALGSAAKFLVSHSYPHVSDVRATWRFLVGLSAPETWTCLDVKSMARDILGKDGDLAKRHIHKCLSWLALAEMIDKKPEDDRWTFDDTFKPDFSKRNRHDDAYESVMATIRTEGSFLAGTITMRRWELKDYLTPILGSGWSAKLKRWEGKGMLKCISPTRHKTTIRRRDTTFDSFGKTSLLLAEATSHAFAAHQEMVALARMPAKDRAKKIEEITTFDIDEFKRLIDAKPPNHGQA